MALDEVGTTADGVISTVQNASASVSVDNSRRKLGEMTKKEVVCNECLQRSTIELLEKKM